MDYLKRLLKKHGDLLRYFLSGSCTSMIGIFGYSLLVWWGMSPVTANVTAWSIEVSVAYMTNKRLVFRDDTRGAASVARQALEFLSVRLFSMGVETTLIWLATSRLGLGKYIAKPIFSFCSGLINYTILKLLVFCRREKRAEKEETI